MITSFPVFIILLFLVCSCKSDDRLTPASPLLPGEKLISNSGVFALGFFSPDSSNKSLFVGIWYNNIPVHTYVWVANRNNPIATNSSGKLVVTNSSDLVVLDSTSRVLWTTKNSFTAGGVGAAAILLNSGNLVIRLPNETDIWQSSDHPTDTILPNMRFWTSKKYGIAERLIAWKGPNDPSTGNFSMGGDSNLQVFIWNGTRPYWRKAVWDGAMVSGMYQSNSNSVIFQRKATGEGDFYTMYTVSDDSPSVHMTLDRNGMVRFRAWNNGSSSWSVFLEGPSTGCDRYGSCGPFGYCDNTETAPKCKCLDGFERDGVNFSIGCRRREELKCGDKDTFMTLASMKTPDKFLYLRNRSVVECAAECSRNCSCTAYSYANLSSFGATEGPSRCLVWMGELVDMGKFSDGSGESLYLRVPSSTVSKKESVVLKIVLPAMASLLIITCICLFWVWKSRGKRRSKKIQNKHTLEQLNSSNLDNENLELPFFHFEDIITATNNFCNYNILGKGGFGKVYKGMFEDGKEVAVKRLSKDSGQGTKEFRNEVVLIAKLQHRNLVRLIGYCIHEDEKLLIYEYLSNKGLDAFLFDATTKFVLDWPTRLKIIKGVARGLVYLHHDSRLTIIHRDLKASNILLDKDMSPKISDFGLARIVGGNRQQEKTTRVVGTYGYMAPEYALEGSFSFKSDTYSFGVLLLEIVSGLKISSPYLTVDFSNLITYAWTLWKDGNARDLVDSKIVEICPLHEVLRCIHLGLLCVQDHPNARPLMSSVLLMLQNETDTLPSPKQPVYFAPRNYETEDSRENMRGSLNNLSITTLEGR